MKKLLNSLYITNDNAYLKLDGENIVCCLDNNEKFRLPLSNIEDIYCFSYLGCSPALMGKCVEYGIALNFLSPSGRFLARVTGASRGNVILRKKQIEMFSNPPVLLKQNTVSTKLINTRSLIKRSLKDYPSIDSDGKIADCISLLEKGIKDVYNYKDNEIILGIEGNCAKAYFSIFNNLILQQKDDFYVTSRTKRPPLDRVNAMLSFLYTIYTCSYASALESVGLDSYVGFYHSLRPGRSSLACDLIEEVRCIVDRLVLTMINLKMIKPNDFETQPSGAVFLNKDGKKKVLSAWQDKKRSVIMHPYLKQKIQLGLLPFVQSNLLAKFIRGEIQEYPSFIMK